MRFNVCLCSGPRQVAWNKLLPMTVIYSLIFVSGLAGNLSTCIVIVQNPHMHTATNYYLFSLAVSDLLTLVFGRCISNNN